MSVAEVSRDRVEGRLASLEQAYSSFPVNQTTLSVAPNVYERARERCRDGLVEVYVTVRNDADEVLLVEGDDQWAVPHAEPGSGDRLEERARRAVREDSGVECTITDLRKTIIVSLRDEDDPEREPVYRLITVFAGEHVAGSPDGAVQWRATLPDSALPSF